MPDQTAEPRPSGSGPREDRSLTVTARNCILCALAAACLLWAQADDRRQIFREIDRSLQDLESISGLKAKKPIHYDLITKDKVNEFLKDRVKESSKPDEVRAEEITLKKLGFVPADFNLENRLSTCSPSRPRRSTITTKRSCSLTDWAPSTMPGIGSGPRTGACPRRSAFPSGALHQGRRQERRQRTGPHGRDGRAGRPGS